MTFRSLIFKELKMKELAEQLRQISKYANMLSDKTVDSLATLKESEETLKIIFSESEHYEEVQMLVSEGFISKDFGQYDITEEGEKLLEGINSYKENPEAYEAQIVENEKEEDENTITVTYKSHIFEQNIIEQATATFYLDENDGLPIVPVSASAYSGLLNREKGQHWKKYLGEEGRQLIRQKKLSKFYVEDADTGRRYLYIVPKKKIK